MNDDIRKLLGGYATGTLTEAEREELFKAALDDQQLFEALADEQVLKELLEDSAARAALLQATEAPKFTVAGAFGEWLDRPKSKLVTGVGVVALAVIGIRALYEQRPVEQPRQPEVLAELRRQPAPERDVPANSVKSPAPAVPARAIPRAKRADSAPIVVPEAPAAMVAAEPKLADAKVEVAADQSTRIAKSGTLQLQYSVLLRQADGQFLPVAADHIFSPGDRVKLRVQPSERGVIVVQTGSNIRFTGTLEPASPTLAGDEFKVDEADAIEVAFSPMPPTLQAAPVAAGFRASEDALARQEKRAARASVSRSAAEAVDVAAAAPPAPGLQVRIVLRKQ